jgi:hypothetical protein
MTVPPDLVAAGRSVVFAGHIFRGSDMDDASQTLEERRLAGEIRALFQEEQVRTVHGSLAAGADILFAEAAIALRLDLHVILPSPPEQFVRSSVAIGNPGDAPARWDSRFWDAMDAAEKVTFVSDGEIAPWQADAYYLHAFRWAGAAALFKADARGSECLMAAISDGGKTAGAGGTISTIEDWLARGRRLRTLSFAGTRSRGHAAPGSAPAALRPVLFLESDEGLGPIAETARTAFRENIGPAPVELDAGAVAFVGASVSHMMEAAAIARDAASHARLPLRMVCDFGPAVDETMRASRSTLAGFPGAAMLATIKPGRLFATPPMMMEARFEARELALALEPLP